MSLTPIVAPTQVTNLNAAQFQKFPETCIMQGGFALACVFTVESMGDAHTRAMELNAAGLTYEPGYLTGIDQFKFFQDPAPVLDWVQSSPGALITLIAGGRHRLALIGAPRSNIATHEWIKRFAA